MKTQVQEVVFSAGLLGEEWSERSEKYSQWNNIKLLFTKESADSFESACRKEQGESTENCPQQTGTEIYQARTLKQPTELRRRLQARQGLSL